jgi:hypothetical protein
MPAPPGKDYRFAAAVPNGRYDLLNRKTQFSFRRLFSEPSIWIRRHREGKQKSDRCTEYYFNLCLLCFLRLLLPQKAQNAQNIVFARAGKSVHGLHREEPITPILKIYNSVFSALFGVSVYQKVKSG